MISTTAFLIAAVALLAAGQVLQKLGAARHLADAKQAADWGRALLSPELLGAALCLALGMVAWLFVLYSTDVSRAFPILSFGSIVVLAASRWYLKEHVPAHRWAGALLIVVGIVLVSAS
ncbi:MAG TPA: EamA family transporter [Gammaproteobacteria bacterium]